MSRGYATFTKATGLAPYMAWGSAVSGAIASALGTKTTDTGQVNWGSVASEPSVIRDFEIYKLGAAIQATAPAFLRIDYAGSTISGTHGVSVSVGTSTDGAGNLTGIIVPRTQAYTTSSARTGTVACYASSDRDSYFNFIYTGDPTAASLTGPLSTPCFSVERTRDLNGTATGDGIVVHQWRGASSTVTSYAGGWAASFTGGYQPLALDYNAPIMIPNATGLTSTFVTDTAYAFPVYPYSGMVVGGASKALLMSFGNDFPRFSEVTVTHYGQAMKFIGVGDAFVHNIPALTAAGAAGVKAMVPLFRWE